MTPLRSQYPLALLCRVLEVSRSGGLCLAARASVDTHPGACAAGSGIQAAHVRTRHTYGPERLQAELRDDGFPAGVGHITRLRKKLGLRCQ